MTTASDHHAELLARFQAGDERCLAELLHDFEPEIRRVARLRLGPLLRPHLDSLDMVQSVCVTLIEGFRRDQFTVTQPEQLVALAAGIIRRKIAAHLAEIAHANRCSGQFDRTRRKPPTLRRDRIRLRMTQLRKSSGSTILKNCSAMSIWKTANCWNCAWPAFRPPRHARQMGANADVLRVRLSRLRRRLEASGITPQSI